jgi:hypothetical protein
MLPGLNVLDLAVPVEGGERGVVLFLPPEPNKKREILNFRGHRYSGILFLFDSVDVYISNRPPAAAS